MEKNLTRPKSSVGFDPIQGGNVFSGLLRAGLRSESALFVLLLCLLATGFGWYQIKAVSERAALERFDFRVNEISSAVKARLSAYEHVLRGGLGLFAASTEVNRHAWRDYVGGLRLGEDFPGMQGIGFSKRVSAAEKAAHIRALRAEGFPHYDIKPAGQRLLKKLCPACKSVTRISPKEADRLAPFARQLPPEVAHPTGCSKCNGSGFAGREGVYEVIRFDNQIAEMTRSDKSAALIREFVFHRDDYLIAHHAVAKVGQLLFPVDDVYQRILAEESAQQPSAPAQSAAPAAPAAARQAVPAGAPSAAENCADKAKILLVEDDRDSQALIRRHLESQGYGVITADDGIEALMQLGKARFDLIISDIDMPSLDGFKLLETKQQKQIAAPLILLTGDTDEAAEIKGYEMGVADYLKKPIKKELLLLRVKKVLQQANP